MHGPDYNLTHRVVKQALMWRHTPDIKPVQQPVQFLNRQFDRGGVVFDGPGEFVFLQPFVPQAKTIALPVQKLDAVAGLVDEHEQRITERIERQ